MKLQTLLKQLLKEDVEEGAVPVGQAKAEHLALFTSLGRYKGFAMLYNPLIASNALLEASETNRPQIAGRAPWREREDVLEHALENSRAIVGYISFEPHDKSFYTVSVSAAETGYGPLLYDIALSTVYPKSLTSDRHTVSKAAQRIWNYYFDKRDDVNKQLIPGAVDIKQYGKVIPTLGVGSEELRYLVQDYRETTNQLEDIESLEVARAKNSTTGPDKTAEKTELNIQLETLADDYKTEIASNPLAYKYNIKEQLSVSAIINAHSRFVAYLQREYKIPTETVRDVFDRAGEQFARNKMP